MSKLLVLFALFQTSLSQSQNSYGIVDVHISSLPQKLLVRVAIDNERRFDSSFMHLKLDKTISGSSLNIDSIHSFKSEILNSKSIDIRSKLQIFYKDGTIETFLIDANGLILFKKKIFSGNDYIMRLIGYDIR